MATELLLVAAGLALLLLAAATAYVALAWPAEARRRDLARQARTDYENARGTAHLRLLNAARDRLQAEYARATAEARAGQARLVALQRERGDALVAALDDYLARQRFELEVDGVGPVLVERILQHAFRGRLADLTRASYYVEGIGANRQQAIDDWVKDRERRRPALLATNFPGKSDVMRRYAGVLAQASAGAQRLAAEQASREAALARLDEAIRSLEQVTVHDFERALIEPGSRNPALESYLRGVYAEWEPAPAWFRQLAGEESQ